MIQKYLIGAVAGLAALIGAYFYGVGVGKDAVRAEAAVALSAAAEALRQAQAAVGDARLEVARIDTRRQEVVREIYRDIPTIVQGDPVYRNLCVTGDGVRLLDRAAAAANGDLGGAAAGASGNSGDAAIDRPGDGRAEN